MSFGELALMYGCPRAASVQADNDMIIYGIDSITFKVLMLRSVLPKIEESKNVLQNCQLIKDNFNKNELTVLADAFRRQKFSENDVIYSKDDEYNDEKTRFYIIS